MRRTRSRSHAYLLEDRTLLSGLIGVDFGNGGTSPTNWRAINSTISDDFFNLAEESGTVTAIDLHVEFDSQWQDGYTLFIPPGNQLPQHTVALTGIERAYSDKGNVTLTYSSLTALGNYDVYVFAGNTIDGHQRVTVTGSGTDTF